VPGENRDIMNRSAKILERYIFLCFSFWLDFKSIKEKDRCCKEREENAIPLIKVKIYRCFEVKSSF
jgi:hypothetical protein